MVRTMHAVVTGGAGFIGSHLVERLLTEGYTVDVVDTLVAGRFKDRFLEGAQYHEFDVRDHVKLGTLIRSGSLVFHLAALPRIQDSIEQPLETFDVNVGGTASVLEAARVHHAARVVFASSAAVYGESKKLPLQESGTLQPVSPYGVHKQMGEQLLHIYRQQFSVAGCSLRFFNVYGPRMDPSGAYALVVGKFVEAVKSGLPVPIVGDGSSTRDFVHVRDVANALFTVAVAEHLPQYSYNIGSGVETQIRALATLCSEDHEYLPARDEVARSLADISLIRNDLDWQPQISLEEGVMELLGHSR